MTNVHKNLSSWPFIYKKILRNVKDDEESKYFKFAVERTMFEDANEPVSTAKKLVDFYKKSLNLKELVRMRGKNTNISKIQSS